MTRIDVDAIRATQRIEDVVAASGVTLRPQGHGFMACCPFHDDSTASMSVGGVGSRFKCFGCGVGGDVIEYVMLFANVTFRDAATRLQDGADALPSPRYRVPSMSRRTAQEWSTTPSRLYEVNECAWQHFTTAVRASAGERYLTTVRRINITALRACNDDRSLVGYAPNAWTSLTDDLLAQGVNETELLDADLAHRSRAGHLIDTYRGRVIVPVRRPDGLVQGFVGRDTTNSPDAPKYRNPTRTPVFDKSTALYRPMLNNLDPDAVVVVVEGVIDALAIAAAAAQTGQSAKYAPCTTNGTSVSPNQASQVLAMHDSPPVIALDGDTAGEQGTLRWLGAVHVGHGRPALVTHLPRGTDPADWIASGNGLHAFTPAEGIATHPGETRPRATGWELVQFRRDKRAELLRPFCHDGGIAPSLP